jgi:hypothetical protein
VNFGFHIVVFDSKSNIFLQINQSYLQKAAETRKNHFSVIFNKFTDVFTGFLNSWKNSTILLEKTKNSALTETSFGKHCTEKKNWNRNNFSSTSRNLSWFINDKKNKKTAKVKNTIFLHNYVSRKCIQEKGIYSIIYIWVCTVCFDIIYI